MNQTDQRSHQTLRGFTLAEMAIVVLLIGIMMSLGIAALNSQMDSSAYSSTKAKQAAVKDALINYLAANQHLPCPDTDFAAPDGVENRTAAAGNPCFANIGLLPYVTLGISKDLAVDGFQNFFTYRVSNAPASRADWTTTLNFHTDNQGAIAVDTRDTTGALVVLAAPPTGAVVLLISHGKNGSGAYAQKGTLNAAPTGLDEQKNTRAVNGVPTFFKRDFNTNVAATGGAFDDSVLMLMPVDFTATLLNTGQMQPQSFAQQFIRQAVTVMAIAGPTKCRPPTLAAWTLGPPLVAATSTSDQYGTQINYFLNPPIYTLSDATPTTPSDATVAFRIWSSGPDLTNNSGATNGATLVNDDIGLGTYSSGSSRADITYGDLRKAIATGVCP